MSAQGPRAARARVPHLVLDGAAAAAAAVGARRGRRGRARARPSSRTPRCAPRSPSAATAAASGSQAVPDGLPDRRGDRARPGARGPPGDPDGQPAAAVASAGCGRRPTLVAERRDAGPPRARSPGTARRGSAPSGRRGHPGSALVTLGGGVRAAGVHEIALGTRAATLLDARRRAGRARCARSCSAATTAPGSTPAAAAGLTLDRDALAAAGATLGAGVVAVLPTVRLPGRRGRPCRRLAGGADRRPVRPVRPRAGGARATRSPSSRPGAAGPATASTGCGAGAARSSGRGACHHPDGDGALPAQRARGLRARVRAAPALRGLRGLRAPAGPAPPRAGGAGGMSLHLRVHPIACTGHGACAELLPEMIVRDDWGYPIVDGRPIPPELLAHARRAAAACPTLALPGRAPARGGGAARRLSALRPLRPGAAAARSAAARGGSARAAPRGRWPACARGAGRCRTRRGASCPGRRCRPRRPAPLRPGPRPRRRRSGPAREVAHVDGPAPWRSAFSSSTSSTCPAAAAELRARAPPRSRSSRSARREDRKLRSQRSAWRRTSSSTSRSTTSDSAPARAWRSSAVDGRVEPVGLGQGQLGLGRAARPGRRARRPPRGAGAGRSAACGAGGRRCRRTPARGRPSRRSARRWRPGPRRRRRSPGSRSARPAAEKSPCPSRREVPAIVSQRADQPVGLQRGQPGRGGDAAGAEGRDEQPHVARRAR